MRSTTAETTNPLSSQKQTTGSPFGAVLASTETQASPVAGATTTAMSKGSNAGTSIERSQIDAVADASDHGLSQKGATQIPAAIEATDDDATRKVAPAAQSTTSASPTSNVNGSVRAASRDEKAEQTSEAAVVNAPPLPDKTILPQQPIALVASSAVTQVQLTAPAVQPVAPVTQMIDPVVSPTAPAVKPAAPAAPSTAPAVQAAPTFIQPDTHTVQPITPAVQSMNPVVQPIAEPLSGQQNERLAGGGSSAVTVRPITANSCALAPEESIMPAQGRPAAAGPRPIEAANPNQSATAENDAPVDPATTSMTGNDGSVQQGLTVATVLPNNILLPDAGLPGNDVLPAGAGPAVGKGGQNAALSATSSKVSDATSAGGTGKTAGVDSTTASTGTHSVQSGPAANATTNQAGQTAQPASNGAQAPAKSTDNGAPPVQAISTPAAVHDTRRTGDGVGDGPHSTELTAAAVAVPRENGESTQTSAISTARLIQTMNETGMQVGLRSAEFGDISIRTSVSQQQMLAQISVDHGDLGKAITMHVPAVQSKLGEEFGLRASIEVHQSGASFSGEQGSSSAGQQRPYGRSVQTQNISAETESLNPAAVAAAWDGNRLDVRA